jgi:hypothetical protein
MDLTSLEIEFSGELYHWRGPAPYHFIKVPEGVADGIREVANAVSYGWGVIPVTVRIGRTQFVTSLFPKDGGYVVPIKDKVRLGEGLTLGDTVTLELAIRSS